MVEIEGKRVAVLVGDEFEDAELFVPKRALEGAGVPVTIVGADDRAIQKIRAEKGLDEGQSVKVEEIDADVTASVKPIGHVLAIPRADAVLCGRSYVDESA